MRIGAGALASVLVAAGLVWSIGSLVRLPAEDEQLPAGDESPPLRLERFRVGGFPTGVAATDRAVWVVDGVSYRQIRRIDPETGRVDATITRPSGFTTVTAGLGSVWATTGDGAIARINPRTARVASVTRWGSFVADHLVVGERRLWLGGFGFVSQGLQLRIGYGAPQGVVAMNSDARALRSPVVDGAFVDMAVGESWGWLVPESGDSILRVDPDGIEEARSFPLPEDSDVWAVAAGGGAVWVCCETGAKLLRLDPDTGKLLGPIPIPGYTPGELVFGAGSLWAVLEIPCGDSDRGGTVYRIDPASKSLSGPVCTFGLPSALTIGASGVWISDGVEGNLTGFDPRARIPEIRAGFVAGDDSPLIPLVLLGFITIAAAFWFVWWRRDPVRLAREG